MGLRCVVVFVALLFLPSLTPAQTVFDVSSGPILSWSGPYLSGGYIDEYLTGTITINTITGSIVSWDINAPAVQYRVGLPTGGFTFTPSDSVFGFQGCTLANDCLGFATGGVAGPYNPYIELYVGVSTLQGFGGVTGTGGSYTFNAAHSLGYGLQDVDIVTPEPSALLLTGTGLAGMAGAFRRRLFGLRRTRLSI